MFHHQLRDVENLVNLRNLCVLSVDGNPIMDLPHARLFIIYHLPNLEVLNGDAVGLDERQAAADRFARGKRSLLSFACVLSCIRF